MSLQCSIMTFDAWLSELFCAADSGDMLLASGSQDNYIRIWRISSRDRSVEYHLAIDELKLQEDSFSIVSEGLFSYHGYCREVRGKVKWYSSL